MPRSTTQSIPRLDSEYADDELFGALDEAGCCLIEGLVDPEVMDAVATEMEPHVHSTPHGNSEFAGAGTRRTGLILSRSPSFRNHLARHRVILSAGEHLLTHASMWKLSFAHYFELFGGEPAQMLHRDVWKYGAPPFPVEVDLNALWAVSDFTEANGATRIVPGSHLWDDERRPQPGEDVPAVAPKGSVLLYTGRVFHGGGESTGESVRLAVNTQHTVGWLSQTEAMLLEYPPSAVAQWDDDLIRFIGYQRTGPALGHWRNAEDPFLAVEQNRSANPQ